MESNGVGFEASAFVGASDDWVEALKDSQSNHPPKILGTGDMASK